MAGETRTLRFVEHEGEVPGKQGDYRNPAQLTKGPFICHLQVPLSVPRVLRMAAGLLCPDVNLSDQAAAAGGEGQGHIVQFCRG